MSHCHGCGNHDAHCECFRTNKVTHTPGPWGFVNGNQIRSRLHQIARVWMLRSGEGVANARLIAAAPELLAELKKISDGLYSDEHGMWCLPASYDRHDLSLLIAKATGEPK